MSYAFAPARWVASKNGDFRYQGPKNSVLWPSLYGMSLPPENCAGNAHHLFEGFLTRPRSARRGIDSEQPHLMPKRFAKTFLEGPRRESQLASGLCVAPKIGHARGDSKPLRARYRSHCTQQTGRRVEPGRWNPGDPLGKAERIDQGVRPPREDVRLPDGSFLHREEVATRRIVDVGPAIRGSFREGSQLAVQISQNQGPDLARVSRTIVDSRLDDDQGEARTDHRFRNLVVGHPLRSVVLRQPWTVAPLRFVDHLAVRVGEHRERARVDPFPDAEIPHGGQHVPRARHIDALALRPILRADLVPARDVEHPIDSGHRAAQRIRIRDVSRTDIDPERDEVLCAFRVPRNRDHLVSGIDQLPGDATADEAGGPRHKVLRHRLAPGRSDAV